MADLTRQLSSANDPELPPSVRRMVDRLRTDMSKLTAAARMATGTRAAAIGNAVDATQRRIDALISGNVAATQIDPNVVRATDINLATGLYNAVVPTSYTAEQWAPDDDNRLNKGEATHGQNRAMRAARAITGLPNTPRVHAQPAREDAWRTYLGLPQQANTFKVSEHRPSRGGSESSTYLAIPNFLDAVARYGLGNNPSSKRGGLIERRTDKAEVIKQIVDMAQRHNGRLQMNDNAVGVMGNFTLDVGRDQRGNYISYYDKWDLDPGGAAGELGRIANYAADRVGRPFEIYDRIYYDPRTFAPIGGRK